MPDYRAATRRAAKKYGLNTGIFGRQINAESGYNPGAGSPAGARGIAQIMPATAKSWGVNLNDGLVTDDLNAAAKHMAQYVKKYGSYENALRAYNAGEGAIEKSHGFGETNAYVNQILNGHDPKRLGRPSAPRSSRDATRASSLGQIAGNSTASSLTSSPYDVIRALNVNTSSSELAPQDQLQQQLDTSGAMLQAALRAKDGENTTPETPSLGKLTTSSSSVMPTAGTRNGKVVINPGANRAGANMDKSILSFLDDLSSHAGTVRVGTGTNHNRLTVDGNVSDHWDGHAADIPMPVDSRQGDNMAAHAMVAAGVPWSKAIGMAQKGGLYNFTPSSGPYKGHRIQVIWKTNQGGNHHNHVHVGIR